MPHDSEKISTQKAGPVTGPCRIKEELIGTHPCQSGRSLICQSGGKRSEREPNQSVKSIPKQIANVLFVNAR